MRRCARRVQVLAHAVLEHAHVDPGIGFRHADALGEQAEAAGREAAPARADKGGHPRIVPAVDVALVHHLDEPPLGQHHAGEVEPRELVLLRQRARQLPAVGQFLDHPVVERAVVLELERADRVGDALQRVGDAVRVVVERVDAPLVAGAVMGFVPDPVDRRVAHVEVGARHVDLQAQHVRAVRKLARAHPAEQIEVLRDRALAVARRRPGLGQRAARRAHLVGRLAVDIGEPVLDEPLGERVELVVVVRRVVAVLAPVEAQPADGIRDRILVLDVLLRRIGVVVTQVAAAAVFRGEAEIEADRLRVPVMQVAVGLGGEPRDHPPAVLARPIVLGDDGAQEIGRRGGVARGARPRGVGGVAGFGRERSGGFGALRRRSISHGRS